MHQTAREYLDSIRQMRDELDQLTVRRVELWDCAAGVKAIRYDLDKVQTSPSNTFEARMAATLDKVDRMDKRISYLRHELKIRIGIIRSVKGSSGAVLYWRYVSGLSWERIAKKMDCSKKAVYDIHGRALAKVRKITGLN